MQKFGYSLRYMPCNGVHLKYCKGVSDHWNGLWSGMVECTMEWMVNVHRTAKSCN